MNIHRKLMIKTNQYQYLPPSCGGSAIRLQGSANCLQKQAEAEVVPSSSSVEAKLSVKLIVGVGHKAELFK